ncbi:hypothetical protein [Desulfovibrio sp. ZJ200]|uniref:hypothetical protein n=1 Tax=Desulfovibrio sp. ZJ200 TaxID=2709792 RepID=UPI0013EAC1B0|nr:hypothetical protein [Desulfovibrio sp. ZJ200]
MKGVITNAAEITVLQPIDNTCKTGGGPVSVGGCVIVASKGRPFTVHEIFGVGTSQEDIFGPPLPKKAYGMEGLRQLSEAAKECNWVQAVRVVNQKGYRYPSLGFILSRDRGEWDSQTGYAPCDVVSCDGQSFIAAANVTASTTPPATGTGDWMEYSGPVEKDAHQHNESVIVGDDERIRRSRRSPHDSGGHLSQAKGRPGRQGSANQQAHFRQGAPFRRAEGRTSQGPAQGQYGGGPASSQKIHASPRPARHVGL